MMNAAPASSGKPLNSASRKAIDIAAVGINTINEGFIQSPSFCDAALAIYKTVLIMIEAKAKKNCSLIVKNNDQTQKAIIAIINKDEVFIMF